MAAIQHPYLSTLWTDNQVQIFEQAWGEEQDLNHRLICKGLRIAVDLLIKKKWEELQKNPVLGPFGFKEACTRIHKTFAVNGTYPQSFNYLALFRALSREWGLVGVNIHNPQVDVTRAHQIELQKFLCDRLNDNSLMNMWERIFVKLYFVVWHEPSNPVSLRDYLSTPPVKVALSGILRMDFSELEIRFIPVEIMHFCNIEELKLSDNHIDVLPDYIGDLKHLRVLNLEDNDLQELPKDFPNWMHLEQVNLKDNPLNAYGLEQYAAWKRNKAARQE